MLEQIPSFIVLASLLTAFVVLLKRAPNRSAVTVVNCLLISALCFVGGLIVSSMYIVLVGNEGANQLLKAILVAAGTLGALTVYIKIDNKEKLIKAQRED